MAGINVTFQFDHLLKQLESMELKSKQAFLFLLAVSTKQDLALDFGTEAFVYESEVKLLISFHQSRHWKNGRKNLIIADLYIKKYDIEAH